MADLTSLESINEKIKETREIVQSFSDSHDLTGIFLAAQGVLERNMTLIIEIKALEASTEAGDIITAASKVVELNKNLDEVVRLYSEYVPLQEN
jgi:hypothetical protein